MLEAKSRAKSDAESAYSLARVVALMAIAVVYSAQGTFAEDAFPTRPIRLIVPFPPGGPTDVMGRLITQSLSERLGQQVYVDNQPGAGSTLACKIAATADPDGYTLLFGSAATPAIGPTLYHDVEYDPKRFVPVAMVADVPYVVVAGPRSPVTSVAGLIAYASAHPGKLNFGVSNGAPPHMLAAWFKSLTKTDFVIVTYRGGANVLTYLQIDLAVETSSILLPPLRDGSLRPLGTPSQKRPAELPDVPTMMETGVAGFIASSWTGIVAPPGTPGPIVEKVNAAANASLASPATQAQLKTLGAEAIFGTTADYMSFLTAELPKWTAMAKLSGAGAD